MAEDRPAEDRPAEDRPPEEHPTEFLPPQAPGPEPDLGPRPQAAQAPPPPQPPPAPQQPPPPPQAPAAYPQFAPAQQPPPYGGGWQQPPPGPPQYGWQQPPPPWGYPQPVQPDNGPAVTGFVFSLVSAGLLFLSGGLSSVISIGCSIAAIVFSRKGKRKVERGETQKNKGLAQAGFVIGIIGLVLAILATLVWGLILIAIATDDEFRRDFENEFDNSDSIRAALQVTVAAARALAG